MKLRTTPTVILNRIETHPTNETVHSEYEGPAVMPEMVNPAPPPDIRFKPGEEPPFVGYLLNTYKQVVTVEVLDQYDQLPTQIYAGSAVREDNCWIAWSDVSSYSDPCWMARGAEEHWEHPVHHHPLTKWVGLLPEGDDALPWRNEHHYLIKVAGWQLKGGLHREMLIEDVSPPSPNPGPMPLTLYFSLRWLVPPGH